MKHSVLKKYLIIFILLLGAGGKAFCAPNTKVPYMMINLTSDNIILMALNDDFRIDNLKKEIKVYIGGNPTYIMIDEIESLGFLYVNGNVSSIDTFEKETPQVWTIYDINGRLINKSEAVKPDLSGLKRGEIYIIKTDTHTFKYMPYK